MALVARSRLPITTIHKNGTTIGTAMIFGSGGLSIEKRIARNVTMGGTKRRVISISASGSFNVDDDVTDTLNTDATNPGSTPGNQDIIHVNGIMVAGVITASYDRASNMTSCSFRGTLPVIDDLGGAGVVDATDGGVYYETLS